MAPVICMITDRRREGARALIEQVGRAGHAGVDLVQVRERDLDGRALTDLVSACVAAVRGTRTRIIVNDRLDVALACGAHGVHLRSDSFGADRARIVAPAGFLVGRSVHSLDDVRSATRNGPVDYLIFGTVFESTSKPARAASGTAMLAEIVRATPIPVLAVGGVSVDNAAVIARTGAAGIAAISLFTGAVAGVDVTVALLKRAFDGPGEVANHSELR